jgi:modulator of FtsH protease
VAELWHDYFVMVGGGTAALTGLVFVAMSLHLSNLASDPAHRHRARTILTALTAVFIRCGLALMGGQTVRAVGVEIFVVVVGVEVVVLRSLSEALRGSGAAQHEVRSRTLGYVACLIIEQTGAAILIFGRTWGLYAVGVGMMASFLFNVSGAWLLLVGVDSQAGAPDSVDGVRTKSSP